MSDDCDYGPPRTYEVTWKTGHIERFQGHQVTFGSDRQNVGSLLGGMFGAVATSAETLPPRFTIHGQIDGHWRLVISAPEADLSSIRDVTDSEILPATEDRS
jgi:hypothetical protein